MGNVDIAIGKFKELDRRNICDYFVDKIPFAGYYLKFKRLKGKRENILSGLEEDMSNGSRDIDMVDIAMVDKLMIEHNQENIDSARDNHYLFGVLCGVGGLIGIGYALGNYFAN